MKIPELQSMIKFRRIAGNNALKGQINSAWGNAPGNRTSHEFRPERAAYPCGMILTCPFRAKL